MELPQMVYLSQPSASPTPTPEATQRIDEGADIYEAVRDTTFILRGQNSAGTHATFSSGVVLTEDGVAATAFHCVNLYDAAYTATFADGDVVNVRGLIAVDPRNDVALIQLDGTGFAPATLREDALPIGSDVYGFGNAGGYGFTLSRGIHSALREDAENTHDFQHTAAMSQGNSGGPLFDARGELVAINRSKRDGEHINLATPVEHVVALLAQPGGVVDDAVWGESFAREGVAFEHVAFEKDGYYQGQYAGGAFNGLVSYERYEGSVAGIRNWYRGDFVEGQPNGFIARTYKTDPTDYYEHYEMGEFRGLALNGKGMTEYMFDSVRGDFVDGKPHGVAIAVSAEGVYCGQWQDGKRNGRGTLYTGDSARTGNWENDKWTQANDAWLPAFGEGITYLRRGTSTYSFTWDPVPGAAYYLLYVRVGEYGDFQPVLDVDGGAITRFYPQFQAGYSMNLAYIAPNIDVPMENGEHFYVTVQPIVTEAQFDQIKEDGLSDDAPACLVHTAPLSLPYGQYRLFSDNPMDSPYAVGEALADLGAPQYLGLLSSTNIYAGDGIFNPYSIFGAKTALRSIWNEKGQYGSPTSDYSAFNPNAQHPPKIYDASLSFVGYLTKNPSLQGAIDPDAVRELLQAAGA